MVIIYSFRARLLRSIGPQSFRRFLKLSEDWIDGVTKEAEHRERSQVLDMESFKHLRRQNSGAPLFLGLLEYTLGIDLPDAAFQDTTFSKINRAAADMVWWANVSSSISSPNDYSIVPFDRICTRTMWNKPKACPGTMSCLF